MARDPELVNELRDLLEQLAQALTSMDDGQVQQAGLLAEQSIEQLTRRCGAGWQRLDTTMLLSSLGQPERARALARALWIASTIDEAQGRLEQARQRCRRAMELLGRVRLPSEEIDVRAARELGSASARLGATRR